jgi:hypothetical protein
MTTNPKPTFSGHETFQCRQLWLKKGYDFISKGNSFKDPDAVLKLGVGKNMVSSIRFWMKAFGLMNDQEHPTPFADKLLGPEGWDPYLEDEGSLWLLHYNLVTIAHATTYGWIFNEFRREKIEFSKTNFVAYVKRKAESMGDFQVNEKTLTDDFGVFAKMFVRSDSQSKDKEDTYAGLLTELDLVRTYGNQNEEYFVIENTDRNEIPDEIILYTILKGLVFDTSVSLNSIENDANGPGAVFALNRSGLIAKLKSIESKFSKDLVFNDHAGIKEMQFKKDLNLNVILNRYYAK